MGNDASITRPTAGAGLGLALRRSQPTFLIAALDTKRRFSTPPPGCYSVGGMHG